ncbi:MAG: pilin [Patescibacteria group bacterium]|nr:MAG: pilin [Patescibacteria group bacterium]
MKRLFRFALPAWLAILPFAASAQIRLLPPCTESGNCGVSDILITFVNAAEYLIGISGAVALLYFVYGGFTFILAAGDKTKVGKAIGILKSAIIGIAIIFLSGILVRFTTQALTGGTSAIPTIGESCNAAAQKSLPRGCTSSADCNGLGVCDGGLCTAADGLWVSIPAGIDPNGKTIPESVVCIKKDDCKALNSELEKRQRGEVYSCQNVSGASSCVRGLCPSKPADFACCLN